jgi:predicted MFS family arabinose efflux permease
MLSQLGYAFAETFVGLLIARALAGLSGANISAAQTYVTDTTAPEQRTRAIGLLGAAAGIGSLCGPLLGAALGTADRRVPFLCAAGVAAANLAWAAVTIVEPKTRAERTGGELSWSALRRLLGLPTLRGLIALLFVVSIGGAAFEAIFAVFLSRRFDYSRSETSLVYGWVGLALVLAQGAVLPAATRRLPDRTLVIVSYAIVGIGFAFLATAHSLAPLLMGVALVSLGFGVGNPAVIATLTKESEVQHGIVIGAAYAAGALARAIGPVIGSLLFERDAAAPLVFACAVAICSTVATALLTRRG